MPGQDYESPGYYNTWHVKTADNGRKRTSKRKLKPSSKIPVLNSLPVERPSPKKKQQEDDSNKLEPHAEHKHRNRPANQAPSLAFASSSTSSLSTSTPSPSSSTPPTPSQDSSRTPTTPSSSPSYPRTPSPIDTTVIDQPQPRSSNTTTPPPISPNRFSKKAMPQYPILRDDEWMKYSDIWIQIGDGLSPHVSIIDIFRTLCEFGTIESIDINTDINGFRNGKAKVVFSKVIYPFWISGSIDYGFGQTRTVWQRPQGPVGIPSEVNPSRIFPPKLKFDVKNLKFGFMLQLEEFMAMYSTNSQSEISWVVNVRKKKVEITFKLHFDKENPENASVVSGSSSDDSNKAIGRTESYMIEIPFRHMPDLLVPADEDQNGTLRTFVIPLTGPPKCFRLLNDWTKSMREIGLTYWNIYDAWMRQTDIQYNMVGRKAQPVSMTHKQPVIDIGRWTTYRLSFDLKDAKKTEDFKTMMEVLNDHNIRTKPLQAFRVNCNRSQLRPIYNYLDQELEMDEGNSEHLQRLSLTFPVRYQLEVCISHGYLNEHNITPEFIHRLQGMEECDARILLECVQEGKTRFFHPMDIFTTQRDRRADSTKSIPDTCVYMRRATVTPTGILFQTPSVEVSNRVIRKYHRHADRFLRVSFTDEKLFGRIRHTDKEASNELFTRVYRALEQGIVIGDRRYEFLAFGNSQLREHGTYFFAPTDNLTLDKIRDWMGYFDDDKVVAKYASRLGQCFSTTKASKSCKEVKCREILDIKRNGYKFTDGVGKISPTLANLLTDEMLKRRPSPDYQVSCFQFRLAGCKGVLAVDPSVPEDEVHLRKTQKKFWSQHKKLEIIRCSGFASAALNRQLIQVMSSLGVPDEYFRKRVRTMLLDFTEAEFNPAKALQLLIKTIDANQMTLGIANLVRGGFMDSQEPFVMSLIRLWRAWTVKYLKEKAKIALDDGAFLLGVVDETATLRGYRDDAPEDELPQIFCQILRPQTREPQVITGRCIVARNPSLHPGDVRIVEAVDCPELHHLVDVVVFPQTGDRDVPNMLSGGDLDGDDYVVIWDKELIAPGVLINEPPALYTAVTAEDLSRPVEISDIRKFFVEYMKNDRLGAIANAHLAWADKYPEGVKSSICLELAQLHSDAVDYPKSGVKARMQKRHRIKSWPHFFEKPKEERSHKSHRILGQLYDLVERIDFTPRYDLQPNERLMDAFELTADELREAKEVKSGYDSDMRRIMAQHDIKSEFEVWSTFVMSHCNNNDYKFHEEIGEISFSLKERLRKEVLENCPDRSQLPRKVAAMYKITALEIEEAKRSQQEERERTTPRSRGNPPPAQPSKEDIERLPLMSFPWIFPEILVDISQGRLMVPTDYELDHDDASWTQETEFEEVPIASLTIGSDIAVSDEDSEANSNHGSDIELEKIVVEY